MEQFQIQPQMPPARSLGPSVQPYLQRPDHGKRNRIILICALAAIVLFAVILGVSYTHSAGYRVKKGFLRLAREAEMLKNPMGEKLGAKALGRMFFTEGGEADTKLDVTFDTFLGEVTLGVDTDYAKDRIKKEMSASTALSVMNYELGHLDVYADKESVCFSVPELFLKDLYLENENVLAQYNRSMWAQDWLFGKAQGDDFSVDLFSSPWVFADEEGTGGALLHRYAEEIGACRRHMTIEKAGKELYRVSFDAMYVNELVRQILYDCMDSDLPMREDIMGFLAYYDVVSGPDEICFLLEIDGANRIESIRLEDALSLCKGAVRLDGDIYFLGGKNSLEKMQGRIAFDNKNGGEIREQEIVWQVVRSLEQGEYQMESEAKYSYLTGGKKEAVKLGWDLSYDSPRSSFDTKMDAKTQEGELTLEASGDFSHIVEGEGFDLEFEEVNFLIDGEQALKISGEVSLSPLTSRVKQIARPKRAFFSMTEADWGGILEKIDREYGYLLEAFSEYLF